MSILEWMHLEKSLRYILVKRVHGPALHASIDFPASAAARQKATELNDGERLIETEAMPPRKLSNSSDPASRRYRLAKALVSM